MSLVRPLEGLIRKSRGLASGGGDSRGTQRTQACAGKKLLGLDLGRGRFLRARADPDPKVKISLYTLGVYDLLRLK